MTVLTQKQVNGFLDYLDVTLQQVAEAIVYLEKEGLDPSVIELPKPKLLGLPIEFVEGIESGQVSAITEHGIKISSLFKKRTLDIENHDHQT